MIPRLGSKFTPYLLDESLAANRNRLSEVDEGQGCKDAFTSCMKYCRRTTTETAAAQSCQQACQRDHDACDRRR